MRGWLRPIAPAIVILASLGTGCQAPQPPPPAQVMATRAAATGPSPLRPPRRFLAASDWSFAVTNHACVARTEHPQLSLSITIGPANAVEVTMAAREGLRPSQHGSAPAAFGFSGASGSWQIRARAQGQAIGASVPLTERSLDDVLALLGGGQLAARTVDGAMPGLDLPDAGVAGRDWLACPRAYLAGRTRADRGPG